MEEKKIEEPKLEELTTEGYKKSLQKEIEMFNSNIEAGEKELKRYTLQVERVRKIRDIQLAPGNFRPITPRMKYEESEEYWKLQEQEQYDNIRQKNQVEEGTMKRLKDQINVLKDEKASKLKLLNELEK